MTFAAKYTPAQWAEARRLRAEGLTFRAIAKSLGFNSPATVSTRARKEGWWGSENTGVAGLAKGKPRFCLAGDSHDPPRPGGASLLFYRARDADEGVAHEEAVGRL